MGESGSYFRHGLYLETPEQLRMLLHRKNYWGVVIGERVRVDLDAMVGVATIFPEGGDNGDYKYRFFGEREHYIVTGVIEESQFYINGGWIKQLPDAEVPCLELDTRDKNVREHPLEMVRRVVESIRTRNGFCLLPSW